MAQSELEALQAQVEALKKELETLRVAEVPRDYVRGGNSPQGRSRSRRAPKKSIRCFRCRKVGHYESDCRQDPDPAFPGWRYGDVYRRNRGAGPSRESRQDPGARNRECPRGLGPGTSVKPWVPSGEIHPLVIQCYHCYEFWHRDRDGSEQARSARQSSEREGEPEITAAKSPPASPL